MGRNLKLEIGFDYDVEKPDSGFDGWRLISFGRNHTAFEHPDKYVNGFDQASREVTPANIGLRRKLDVGLAFFLSYFEHGQGVWSPLGEGNQCPWDSVYLAGILIWTGQPQDIGAKTIEDRAKDANAFLSEYNDWANGNTYWFSLETEDGENLDSCGGFIGDETLSEAISEHLKDGDKVLVEGDAAWLQDYLSLPDGVEIVDEFLESEEIVEPEFSI